MKFLEMMMICLLFGVDYKEDDGYGKYEKGYNEQQNYKRRNRLMEPIERIIVAHILNLWKINI